MSTTIEVKNLTKRFTLSTPKEGILGAFLRTQHEITAVGGLSFSISPGERVAFIGPNGAGKSTTIKMLCGILSPSSGSISVLGMNPTEQRSKLSYQIGIVFGTRSQLWSHLPVKDSFELLGSIYDCDTTSHTRRQAELCSLMEISDLITTPASKLSLGERMRCELVASLLHRPALLILDEPTIGLDVSARALLRQYMRRISEIEHVTILLTSHDTGDLESVCDRVIVINHGSCILDQSMEELRNGFIRRKRIRVVTDGRAFKIAPNGCRVTQVNETSLLIDLDTEATTLDSVLRELFASAAIVDLTIEDPPLDETIIEIYKTTKGQVDRRVRK